MTSPPPRLRRGELLAGLSGIVLLAIMWVLPWFSDQARRNTSSLDGWQALPILRWIILTTAVAAIVLAVLQAMLRAPAVPVSMSVIVTSLGLLCLLALVIRVPTAAFSPRVGAFIGLLVTLSVVVAGFLSMREESGWIPTAEHPVERVHLRSSAQN